MNLMSGNMCKFLWVMIFFCLVEIGHAAQSVIGQGNISLQTGAGVSDGILENMGNEIYDLSFSAVNEKNINSSDVFFAVQGLTNWAGYHVISVHVENRSEVAARVGIEIKLSPLVVMTATEGQACFWQADGESLKSVVLPVQGMIELSPQDSGTLFIPFDSFSYKGRKFPITYFTAWDFRINAEKNSKLGIRFGEFTLYQADEIDLPNSSETIEGDSVVQIPIEGAESIALYRIGTKQSFFHLAKEYAGVSLTPQGRLAVFGDSQPQIIKIFADMEGENERFIKNVTLKLSDKANVVDQNGGEPLLPSTDKLSPIYDPTSFWTQDYSYVFIRWGLLTIFLVCLAVFLYGNYVYQKKNRGPE